MIAGLGPNHSKRAERLCRVVALAAECSLLSRCRCSGHRLGVGCATGSQESQCPVQIVGESTFEVGGVVVSDILFDGRKDIRDLVPSALPKKSAR